MLYSVKAELFTCIFRVLVDSTACILLDLSLQCPNIVHTLCIFDIKINVQFVFLNKLDSGIVLLIQSFLLTDFYGF